MIQKIEREKHADFAEKKEKKREDGHLGHLHHHHHLHFPAVRGSLKKISKRRGNLLTRDCRISSSSPSKDELFKRIPRKPGFMAVVS